MSNIGGRREGDMGIWQAASQEARHQRRPVKLRAIVTMAILPAALLGIEIADCVRYGFWPRPTSEAAFLVTMLSALVALGFAARRVVQQRKLGLKQARG